MACVSVSGHPLPDPSSCHISILTDDTLQEIFTFLCCNDNPPAEMPVILARVSSQWRRVALSRAKLWTIIQVNAWVVRVPTNEKQKYPRFLKTINRVKTFLQYSRTMPLDVSITLRSVLPVDDDSQRKAVSDVRDVFRHYVRQLSRYLSSHLSRIRNMAISVDEHSCIHDLQVHFPPTSMPHLEYLEIDAFGYQSCTDHQSVAIPLRNSDTPSENAGVGYCPNLTFVYLKGLPLACDLFCPQSLTELALLSLPKCCTPTWTALRRILLANDATLETLHIDFIPPMDVDWEPFTLGNLTSLLLTFKKVKHLYAMVITFDVPNLEYLSITDGQRSHEFPLSYGEPRRGRFFRILSALIDNFPLHNLRQLVLSHIWFFPGNREVDDGIPNAVNLDIRSIPFDFFSALTSLEILSLVSPTTMPLDCLNYIPCDSDAPQPPLPSLRGLHLYLFNKHIVRDFLHTRRYGHKVRGFEAIRLTMPPEWKDDTYLDIRRLCQEPDIEYIQNGSPRVMSTLSLPPQYWLCQYPPRKLFDRHLERRFSF